MKLRLRPDAPVNLVKLAVGRCLIDTMDVSKWTELGLLTDSAERIDAHPRLLRSLRFGDEDYDGHVFDFVPVILGERTPPKPDPWGTPSPAHEPEGLLVRYPNLEVVSDYIDLPAWVAENDTKLFTLVFAEESSEADATLPDGTVLSAAESAAARLEVGEMRRQVERIRRDHADDPEAAVGHAKELIETVCKTILGTTGKGGDGEMVKFPQLVKRNLLHLGIDPHPGRRARHRPGSGARREADHWRCVLVASRRGRTPQRPRDRSRPQRRPPHRRRGGPPHCRHRSARGDLPHRSVRGRHRRRRQARPGCPTGRPNSGRNPGSRLSSRS